MEYNGTSGALVGTFASGGGLDGPSYLTFGLAPSPLGRLTLRAWSDTPNARKAAID